MQKANGLMSICFIYKIICCIAIRETIPGIPRKPDTKAVAKLIGMCSPIIVPNTFKKNNNRAPTRIRVSPLPTRRMGFSGAPINRSKNIIPPKIEITIIGSIKTFYTPFIMSKQAFFQLLYERNF